MDGDLRNLLLERIRAKPGTVQQELIGLAQNRASQNTARKCLKELERDKKIRSRRRGKYVEYTAVDEMQTDDLERTIEYNLDGIDGILRQMRQELGGYPYHTKASLNDSLDFYRDRLREAVETARHASYDPLGNFRETVEEIRGMLGRVGDGSDCDAKGRLYGASLRMSVQLGYWNEDCRQISEKYHMIKFRDAKRASPLPQQLDGLEGKMSELHGDLEKIRTELEKKAVFHRKDVDLCGLADEMEAKYTHSGPRKRGA